MKAQSSLSAESWQTLPEFAAHVAASSLHVMRAMSLPVPSDMPPEVTVSDQLLWERALEWQLAARSEELTAKELERTGRLADAALTYLYAGNYWLESGDPNSADLCMARVQRLPEGDHATFASDVRHATRRVQRSLRDFQVHSRECYKAMTKRSHRMQFSDLPLELATTGVRKFPGVGFTFLVLHRVQMEAGDARGALTSIQWAARFRPDYAVFAALEGAMRLHLRDLDEAERLLRHAYHTHRDDPWIRFFLALALVRRWEETPEVGALLEQAYETLPLDSQVVGMPPDSVLGVRLLKVFVAVRLHRVDEAELQYRRLMAESPPGSLAPVLAAKAAEAWKSEKVLEEARNLVEQGIRP
ncbi:MAG: hypothetical protein HY814_05810 [Candidatus Riflebacteria bacterium]|nr:hypothetical protein [Candidatus Riflebacteria bacterium]